MLTTTAAFLALGVAAGVAEFAAHKADSGQMTVAHASPPRTYEA